MGKTLIVAAACSVAVLFGTAPSQAYSGNAPWCAVVAIDSGATVEQCMFADFESCRQEVVAGNRGFCTDNPRFAAPGAKPKVARKRVRH
jgi:uncharacterized protein DUF3551